MGVLDRLIGHPPHATVSTCELLHGATDDFHGVWRVTVARHPASFLETLGQFSQGEGGVRTLRKDHRQPIGIGLRPSFDVEAWTCRPRTPIASLVLLARRG